MSLLDSKATDRVTIVLYRVVTNERGKADTVEVGRVIGVGRLQPATQAEVDRYAGTGASIYDTKRFSTKRFAGDDLSEVIDADGVTYTVVARPRVHRSSRATSRDIVILSAKKQKRVW